MNQRPASKLYIELAEQGAAERKIGYGLIRDAVYFGAKYEHIKEPVPIYESKECRLHNPCQDLHDGVRKLTRGLFLQTFEEHAALPEPPDTRIKQYAAGSLSVEDVRECMMTFTDALELKPGDIHRVTAAMKARHMKDFKDFADCSEQEIESMSPIGVHTIRRLHWLFTLLDVKPQRR